MAIQQAGEHAYGVQWSEWYSEQQYGVNIRSGDVFVFVNAARNRMKILHREESGLVLYALRIEMGRMRLSFSDETEGISTMLAHADLVSTARSAMESAYVRRMKMLSSSL